MKTFVPFIFSISLLLSCSDNKMEKGFQVSEILEDEDGKKVIGLQLDSLQFETQPRNVLLTNSTSHRLTPIYKVNYTKKGKKFIGSNRFYNTWRYDDQRDGNNWNGNYMPGVEAMSGYNLVNISHFNHETQKENLFFDKPALIKTLYFPSFSKDTLNYQPISRDYYMVSVYDEDTNKDGFINVSDLRRFYLFNLDGIKVKPLIPAEYSAFSSEYDEANDFMYVFANQDSNGNGRIDSKEPLYIFWINLKKPEETGVQFKN